MQLMNLLIYNNTTASILKYYFQKDVTYVLFFLKKKFTNNFQNEILKKQYIKQTFFLFLKKKNDFENINQAHMLPPLFL